MGEEQGGKVAPFEQDYTGRKNKEISASTLFGPDVKSVKEVTSYDIN